MRHVVCFYDLGEAVPVLGILIPLFAAFGDVERGVQVGVQVEGFIFDGTDYTSVLDEDNRFTTPTLYEDASLNVAFEQDGNGISSLSSSPVKVYAQNGRLVVEQVGTGSEICIYDSAGRTVKTLDAQGGRTETSLPTGQVYIVKTVGKTVKIAL